MNQLYIKNVSGGVFKIPFKLGTPYDIQATIKCIIPLNGGTLIPVSVVPYIDLERLEYHKVRREIKVTEKKVRLPRLGIKPKIVSKKTVKKPKPYKADKVKVFKESKEEV